MSEAAVMPRGNAVAVVAAADANGTARPDGRNRRAAETRRKIIEAAKAMITETSTAPTVVAVARRALAGIVLDAGQVKAVADEALAELAGGGLRGSGGR